MTQIQYIVCLFRMDKIKKKKNLKFRMTSLNVSWRQQPDHRPENSPRPTMVFQQSEKIQHPEVGFGLPLNKKVGFKIG